MANNRLRIRCRKCDEVCRIAKYYPSTGWFPISLWQNPDGTDETFEQGAVAFAKRLEAFLEKHSHEATMTGGSPFDIEYEEL